MGASRTLDWFRYTKLAQKFPESMELLLDIVGTERVGAETHRYRPATPRLRNPRTQRSNQYATDAHLPLQVGNGDAGIVVNGEALEWVEGSLIIDTTFSSLHLQ